VKHTEHYSVNEVAPYIQWGYFLHAWGFPFKYAQLTHVHDCDGCRNAWISSLPGPEQPRAREANRLLRDARSLLNLWAGLDMHTHFRVALFNAFGDGDNIYLPEVNRSIPLLRQQTARRGEPCLCLSDFVRPRDQGVTDKIGVFASTTDACMEQSFLGDDYMHLLAQTLADRLAEATAELGHMHTRRTWWGYAPDEHLTTEELFAEKYQGRRPAVGYPSLPDQSINFLLDELTGMKSLGITLTETGAMLPRASTSGLMISHPATRHFAVGAVGEDQMEDYAKRRGVPVNWVRRFL